MPLIECPKCNSKISDRANFCPKCGTSTTESKKCPDCFSDITDEMESCAECGCPLREEIPSPAEIANPRIQKPGRKEAETANCDICMCIIPANSEECPECGAVKVKESTIEEENPPPEEDLSPDKQYEIIDVELPSVQEKEEIKAPEQPIKPVLIEVQKEEIEEGEDRLLEAIEKKDVSGVESLLVQGWDTNKELCGLLKSTYLLKAIESMNEYEYKTNVLTDEKGYKRERDKKGRDYKKIIELLVEHGADVNGYDQTGKTPLHMLLIREEVPIISGILKELIEFLLKQGANASTQDRLNKETPLHIVQRRDMGYEPNLILFLEWSANPDITDWSNMSALGLYKWGKGLKLVKSFVGGEDGTILKSPRKHTYYMYKSKLDYYMNEIVSEDRPCCGGRGKLKVWFKKEEYERRKKSLVCKMFNALNKVGFKTLDLPWATCCECDQKFNYCPECDTIWSIYDVHRVSKQNAAIICPECKTKYEGICYEEYEYTKPIKLCDD